MLQKMKRGEPRERSPLSEGEDRALREAFGRFAEEDARARGAEVVLRYQKSGSEHWFLCDCLGDVLYPPALVLVEEAYVRRYREGPWPEHHEDCDFWCDPADQRATSKSYKRPPDDEDVSLLGEVRVAGPRGTSGLSGSGISRPRSKLARLLMRLVKTAGLDVRAPGIEVLPIKDQYAALRAAAATIRFERSLHLSNYFWTFLPKLAEFKDRISTIKPEGFPKSRRPHGVLVSVVTSASEGLLRSTNGDIPVRGKIAIFGESDGSRATRPSGDGARSPYLAICLVGRSAPDAMVEVLEAYLHPCVSHRDLMLVDSNHERDTLVELGSLQAWLLEKKAIAISIEKPLFHIPAPGRDFADGDPAEATQQPEDVCIPDFILRQEGRILRGNPVVVVETMGFADETYRHRKRRIHGVMSVNLGGAPVIEHDFCYPSSAPQLQRNRDFWSRCRWAVTGPEPRPGQ